MSKASRQFNRSIKSQNLISKSEHKHRPKDQTDPQASEEDLKLVLKARFKVGA